MNRQNESFEYLNNFLSLHQSEFGVHASSVDKDRLPSIVIPDMVRDEIPTKNECGYMKVEFDEFMKEFIKLASEIKQPVLEIGTAYGHVAQKVLENWGKLVVNDLSCDHLAVLLKRINKNLLKNLFIKAGKFPDKINFPQNSFAAILISRVMHFLNEDEIQTGFDKLNEWLVPGGKLFFSAITPYHFTLRDNFLPIYNERWLANDPWPGKVEGNKSLAGDLAQDVPDSIQVFDVPQLEGLMPKHGFTIEKIKLYDYQSNDSDGKGHVGFVAIKE